MKQKNGVWRKILLPSIKHTDKQLNKMTKKGLIRLVKKLEKILIKIAYQQYKSKLPRLSLAEKKVVSRFKGYKKSRSGKLILRKPKRKFSRKQLAAQRLFAKRAKAGTLRSSKGGFIFKGKRYSGTRMSYSNVNGRLVRR